MTVDSSQYVGKSRPLIYEPPTVNWAKLWTSKLINGDIDRMIEIPTSPWSYKSNLVPSKENTQSRSHRIIFDTNPHIHRFNKPFFFEDFWDIGHMNARGRAKFEGCLCELAMALQKDGAYDPNRLEKEP